MNFMQKHDEHISEKQQSYYDSKESTISFIRDYSTETTPTTAENVARFRDYLPPHTSVYITFLPKAQFSTTLSTAKCLAREGFNPVPHLAARSFSSRISLDDSLARLAGDAGVTEVLAIAGAMRRPLGPFSSSMELLESGLLDKHSITRIGVAGHPEGSPDITEEVLAAALNWKNYFTQRTEAKIHIVSQMCFDAQPIITWNRRIQGSGNELPIRVGVPGVATIRALLKYARICGIGPSVEFLSHQARSLSKLLTVSTPDRLLRNLAAYTSSNPDCGIVGCHLFPLGGMKRTARWIEAIADARFGLRPNGDGFIVKEESVS